MKAMILAAGRGERMRALTDNCPKPLLKLKGRPLIVYTIENLKRAGITEIVINVAYRGEQIQAALKDGSEFGIRIQYSVENQALETGAGIQKALPLLCEHGNKPFIVTNADIYTDFDYGVLKNSLKDDDLAHLVLVDNPLHNPQGDFLLLGRRLARPQKHCGIKTASAYTFSGVSVLHPNLFCDAEKTKTDSEVALKPFPLRELLWPAMDNGQVSGDLFQGLWVDIGTPERLAEAERL